MPTEYPAEFKRRLIHYCFIANNHDDPSHACKYGK